MVRIIGFILAAGMFLFGLGWALALTIFGDEAAKASVLAGAALMIVALIAMVIDTARGP